MAGVELLESLLEDTRDALESVLRENAPEITVVIVPNN